jgi:hypothetical protein
MEVNQAGGVGLFLINKRGNKKDGMKCWALTPEYIHKLNIEGHKSIKWSLLQGLPLNRVRYEGKPAWDMAQTLELFRRGSLENHR